VSERTTIQVRRDLLPKLEALKSELRLDSYDAVIRVLLRERRKPTRSLFGAFPGVAPFQREEIDRLD